MWKRYCFCKLIPFIPILLLFLSSCFTDYDQFNYYKEGPLADLYEVSVRLNKEIGVDEKSAEIRAIGAKGNQEEIEKAGTEYGEYKEIFLQRLKAEYDVTQIEIPYEYKGENQDVNVTGIIFSDLQFKGNIGETNYSLFLSVHYEIVGDPPPYDFLRIELLNTQNQVFASYHQVITEGGLVTFPLKANIGLSYLQKIHIY